LLACIVKDGLRTGDIVRRTRALIENAPPVSETQCPVNVDTVENVWAAPSARGFVDTGG
jgi:hypothetical protein